MKPMIRSHCLMRRLREATGVDLRATLTGLLNRLRGAVLVLMGWTLGVCLTLVAAVLVPRLHRRKTRSGAVNAGSIPTGQTPHEIVGQGVEALLNKGPELAGLVIREDDTATASPFVRLSLPVVPAPGTLSLPLVLAPSVAPPATTVKMHQRDKEPTRKPRGRRQMPLKTASKGTTLSAMTVKELRRRLVAAGRKAPVRARKADLIALLL